MASIQILGKTVPLEFLVGREAQRPLNEAALTAGAQEMAALINSKNWSAAQAAAFKGINKIVFFEGKVMINGHEMDRPACDEDDAIFYWEAEEFERNSDTDVRANTFFHDCWHVVQFRDRGGFAMTRQEQVAREVDAINRQIEVAEVLGNDDREIQFLRDFRDDQERIKARLDEGVGENVAPHKPGFLRS